MVNPYADNWLKPKRFNMSTRNDIAKYILGTLLLGILVTILIVSVTANYMAPTNTVEAPNPYNTQHIYY